MDERTTFRGPEVCKLAGVTYRQLDYWCRTGVLRPAVPASGSGSQRLFDLRGVQIVWSMAQLSRLGQLGRRIPRLTSLLESIPRWGGWLILHPDGISHTYVPDELGLYPAAVVVDLDWCPIGTEVPERETA